MGGMTNKRRLWLWAWPALILSHSTLATTRVTYHTDHTNAKKLLQASSYKDRMLLEGSALKHLQMAASDHKHFELHTHIGIVDEGIIFPLAGKFGSIKVHANWMYSFSAFWDPLREEIRFFFDALEQKAKAINRVLLLPHGSNNITKDATELLDCRLQLISDPGGVIMQHIPHLRNEGDAVDFLEGWQLTCPAVAKHFRQGIIVYDSTRYTSFRIEHIKTERVGKVAACVGPLYTQRRIIKPFILYASRLGIERFDIYHTLVSDFTVANPFMVGIWPSSELSQHEPLEFLDHPRVRWHSYEAPPLSVASFSWEMRGRTLKPALLNFLIPASSTS